MGAHAIKIDQYTGCSSHRLSNDRKRENMTTMHVQIGDQVRFAKTVGETDIYLFSGITGDFSGNHVNEEFMKKSIYGRRIAHGVLMIGYMSTASTLMIDRSLAKGIDSTPVSLGYDRVRFLGPVFIGDTVEVVYTIAEIDLERRRSRAKVDVRNQRGELVAVAEHILKWVQRPDASKAAA
jgi:3-hydroxybutyryl-CoA dehydratase